MMVKCVTVTGRVPAFLGIAIGLMAAAGTTNARGATQEWVRQFGTGYDEGGGHMAIDNSGNILVGGLTWGSLGGSSQGSGDGFFAKYDPQGNGPSVVQYGTPGFDTGLGISADHQGNVVLCGTTNDNLGGTAYGMEDAYLTKYDYQGNLLWKAQVGTSSIDQGYSVSTDTAGNIYLSGYTEGSLAADNQGTADAFLTKYDSAGHLLWQTQLGTSTYDVGHSVSVDRLGNVFLTVQTSANLGGSSYGGIDTCVAKYDSDGNRLWITQIGSASDDQPLGASTDGLGNLYVTGWTTGDLAGPNQGDSDAFLAKLDSQGNVVWKNQYGTSAQDYCSGISADGLGNVFISGYTRGNLVGTNQGEDDAFLIQYDADGNRIWQTQIGTSSYDEGWQICADGHGSVYLGGETWGRLGGTSYGGDDVFLIKYTYAVPEPMTLGLVMLGGLWVLRRR